MNLKKIKIITAIIIFILCFPLHFIYEWIPSVFTAIFFPVNESIWEHMKILYTAFLLGGLIEYILLKYFKVDNDNLGWTTFVGAFLSVPLYLLIFLPLYYMGYESMALNIGCMIVVIIIISIINYLLSKLDVPHILNYISILGIIITYVAFAYLTYYPIKHQIFYDTEKEKYGVSSYSERQIKRTEYYLGSNLYKTLKR